MIPLLSNVGMLGSLYSEQLNNLLEQCSILFFMCVNHRLPPVMKSKAS